MDGLLIALVVFITIDYITGIMCAVIDKKVRSNQTVAWLFFCVLFGLIALPS